MNIIIIIIVFLNPRYQCSRGRFEKIIIVVIIIMVIIIIIV